MNTQRTGSVSDLPEALRLADAMENKAIIGKATMLELGAAAELRRLHEVNQELLGALKWIDSRCHIKLMDYRLHGIHKEMAHDAGACARAAIAKHGGEE